jgi:hypothetical protein
MGERSALKRLSAGGKANVSPLVVVFPDQFASPAQLVQQIDDVWGASKIYVDAAYLPGTAAKHSLDAICTAAASAGLTVLPAIPATASPDYAKAVARVMALHKQGAAMRISFPQMTSSASWLGSLTLPQGEVDLIIDMGDSVASVHALGTAALDAFAKLHSAKGWRSVTATGGSIPADLTGYVVGSTMLDRSELLLWRKLKAHGLGYTIHFGDYATIGPNATTEAIPGPVPINAKYTHASQFQILHGVRETGPKGVARAKQYRKHANAIIAHPGYASLAHCWSDGLVPGIAAGTAASAGSPTSWVSIAINRHIELTRTQLP